MNFLNIEKLNIDNIDIGGKKGLIIGGVLLLLIVVILLFSKRIPLPTPTPIACDGGVITTGSGKTIIFPKYTMTDDCVIVGDSTKGNFDFGDKNKNADWNNGAVFAFSTEKFAVKQFGWFITDGEYAPVPKLKAKDEFCNRVKQLFNQKSSDGSKSVFNHSFPLPEWGFSATDLVSKGQCPQN